MTGIYDADGLAERIAEAVSQWLAEQHGGGMVHAFAMVVDFIDGDGERGWASAHHAEQNLAQTLGLLRFETLAVEQQARRYFEDGDD